MPRSARVFLIRRGVSGGKENRVMVDRTTKVLLLLIAIGVWLNVWISASGLSDIRSDLIVLRQWALNGAPVTPAK
jgi:hypothetical protein